MSLPSKAVPLPSRQWSCSELSKGAQLCADLAGMELTTDPSTLSREDLLSAIKDTGAYETH